MKNLVLYAFLLLSFSHYIVHGMNINNKNPQQDFFDTIENLINETEKIIDSMGSDLANPHFINNPFALNIFIEKECTAKEYLAQIDKLCRNVIKSLSDEQSQNSRLKRKRSNGN
jgi:hypothetical protein